MSARVMDRLDLAGDAGSIVLYDWMAEEVKYGRNLMRLDANGQVRWKATPIQPSAWDYFVAIQRDSGAFTANTWSGYQVGVDLENGDVTVLFFTK